MDQEEIKNYIITTHAKERYVERVKGYINKTELNRYVTLNSPQIIEDISKLCHYGKVVFEGNLRKYGGTRLIIKDNWIIICDIKEDKVVTIWKKSLGLSEEFDKEYIQEMVNVINDLSNKKVLKEEEICDQKEKLEETISDNKIKITEYEIMLNALKETNASLETIKDNLSTDIKELTTQISDKVSVLLHG